MKTHLSFTGGQRLLLLTIMAMFFSATSFPQSIKVEPAVDHSGNYVILTKYNSNGDIDLSYGINGSTVHIPIKLFSAVFQPDGKVILIGNTNEVHYVPDIHDDVRLFRVNANGIIDQSFGDGGMLTISYTQVSYEQVVSVEQKTGKVFIGVTSKSVGAPTQYFELFVYRFNSNGVTSLLSQRLDFFDDATQAYKLLDYSNSKYLLTAGVSIYRYDEADQPDLSFNGTGQLSLPVSPEQTTFINDILLHNGSIIAGATTIDSEMGLTMFKVYVFNIDGSPDLTFGDQGVQTIPDGFGFQDMYIEGSTLYIVTYSAVNAYPLETVIPATFTCPSNKLVSIDPGQCSAVVNDLDPVITPAGSALEILYTLSGATTGNGAGSVSGKVFNAGITTVTYSLKNDASSTCTSTVEVQDKEAPVITFAEPQQSVLWPPNHKMVDIDISYALTDNCAATATLSVSSNEAQDATGSEDPPNDWVVVDAHHVRLRAERSGNGNGRVYTIEVKGVDAAGNTTTKQVFVTVPHDASSKEKLKAKAFPNPFNHSFKVFVESHKKELVNIKIVDAYGRLVESRVQVSPNSTIELGNNYKPGLYVVEIIQGMHRKTLHVVKVLGTAVE